MGQEVPSWGGFISLTGVVPTSLTTVDYYPVINHPITDYKTVQECLRYSEAATKEVGQSYVITTFDLGVCMKAYPLVWNNPLRYDKHIILIDTFHMICAYFRVIGKKMAGSGFSDVLMEAGLITSGSLHGVQSGKNYSRAMHCHKILLECLERLLIQQYLKSLNKDEMFAGLSVESTQKIEDLMETPSEEALAEALHQEDIAACLSGYSLYRNEVRNGGLGKTPQFWLSYMDHVWLVLDLVKAVKSNNFLLYARCISMMPDLFFSFDGQNYARYLTFFSVFIANIEESHPGSTELLERGAISIARSFIPGNRAAVDKTIEETFMKQAKSRGGAGGSGTGLSGLLNNYDAYQRWVKTTHERSLFVKATLNMADMLQESNSAHKHRDVRPTEIQKSEKDVSKTKEAIENFNNPFTVEDKNKVYCISSGAPAPSKIEEDVLIAEARGKLAKERFIKDRLEKKDKFFEPVKRLNLKTLANTNKSVKLKAAKNKVVEYRQQGNVAFQLLIRSQSEGMQLDIEQLMTYPLTPVPYSIGTADGFLAKTDKAKGLHYLTKDSEDATIAHQAKTLVVEDGNAYFHYMTEIPSNFKQIAHKVFDMMQQSCDLVFSTDSYKSGSIKAMERKRRGCCEKLIIKGESTKKPADWRIFLTNDDNKKQLIQLILDVWSSSPFVHKLANRQVIFICEGTAYELKPTEDGTSTEKTEIPMLSSTQEETDSRVILYCFYAQQMGYTNVRIRSPDSDIFFILLHFTLRLNKIVLMFDTGTGNKRRLINMSELAHGFTQQYCTTLMCLHAFTGCDTTSAFKGIGKIKPIKLIQKVPRFQPMLARLGDEWDAPEDLMNALEEFTCAMYSRPRFTKVDEVRYFNMKEKCGNEEKLNPSHNVDMGTLPPSKACLYQHIRRVNFQVAIWKRSHEANPDVPEPTNGHGWTMNGDTLEPLWTDGNILPQELIDVLQETLDADEDSEADDEYSMEDDLVFSESSDDD